MSAPSLRLLLPAQDPADQEHATEQAGHALEQAVLPLAVYRTQQLGRPDLGAWQFEHLRQLGALFDALAAYESQTRLLLALHRANTAGLNAQLHLALSEPRPLPADRTTDPLYRIGWVRGYQQATRHQQRLRERLAGLYAQHATLTPPPGYQPSPLVQRLTATLDSPGIQAYAALPLATRQALNALTPGQLQAHLDAAPPTCYPSDPRRAA